MKVLNSLKEAGLYGLLVVIGVVFSMPLLWMMITSVKVDREFLDQEGLFPELPSPVTASPYLVIEEGESVSAERQEGWERAFREVVSDSAPPEVAAAVSREAALAAGEGSEFSPEQVEFLLDRAWRRTVRELLIGQPVLRSRERRTFLYDDAGGWTGHGEPGIEAVEPYRGEDETVRLVKSDFAAAGDDSLALTFLLEMDPAEVRQLDELVVPVYADDSWHRVYFSVRTSEGAWKSRRPFYLLLGSAGWTELSWRKPDFERSRLGYEVFRTLQPEEAGGPPATRLQPGEVLLTFHLERSAQWRAIWGKMTRNYEMVFSAMPFARYLLNSSIIVLLNIVSALLSCSLAAYAFARLRWRGREIYFIIMLATMTLPPQVTMVPTFIIMKHLGLYNSFVPLFLPSLIAVPFFVFLLRQFLKNVPRDLEDAALIDGCGHFRIYWSIMLPLVKPTLVIVVIFSFITSWNDFMGPLIYLSDQNLYPVSLGIFAFQSYAGSIGIGNPAVMMAASTLMVLPVIAVFFFAQRYFTQGIKMTGIK